MRPTTLVLVIIMSFMLPLQNLAQSCDGFMARLQSGMMARVTPGDANNVRIEPSTDAELVGKLDGGVTFLVTSDAVCADGFTWIAVSNPLLDISGYTVERANDTYWTEPATIEILAENLAFDFTPVTDNVSVEVIPESDFFDHYREGGNPAFIQVAFDAPIFSEHLGTEIRIYPIEEFKTINPEFATLLDYDLQSFLATESDLPTPFPRFLGATGLHESHAQLIETDEIVGVRHITQIGQSLVRLSGSDLFFTFQGITRDERYWIYALLPMRAPAVDIYYYDNQDDLIDFNQITQEGHNQLDDYTTNLPDDAFFPTLTALDAVITSLNFYGSEGMPEPVTSRLPDYTIDLTALGAPGFLVDEQQSTNTRTAYFGMNESEVYGVLYIHNQIDMSALHLMNTIQFLRDFLTQRPESVETIVDNQGATVPVLGGVHYIDTDTITGVFYIPAPRGVPVIGNGLDYDFQGLTKDGAYYVRGSYRITTDLLPASRDGLSEEDITRATSSDESVYNGYIAEIQQTLSDATPEDFSPSLSSIIAVFESLSLE